MNNNFIYIIAITVGLVMCFDTVLAQETSSDREKAHIVSRVYEITYGSDEICKRFAPSQAGQVSAAVENYKNAYPELMQLVLQSSYLDQAKKQTQATIGMVAKSASKDPKAAGCQEALWLLKQLVEADGAKQEVEKMISVLKQEK